MKGFLVGLLVVLGVIGGGVGLSYAFGWIGVHQTKTIKKEQIDAEREVFEQSQSYVEGKRQEAQKLYQEYIREKDVESKSAIREIVSISFANFDESKLQSPIKEFVYSCKFGRADP